jgi:F0F1-type ATP synthase membrane subunit a
MEIPKLIETQTKYYILETLRSCHDYRQKKCIFAWNVFILFLFVSIFGFTLYLCAQRKKLTEDNSPQKIQNDQEYILNKIREMREIEKYQTQMKMMTQLPVSTPITSDYETQRLPEHSSGYAY